MASQNFPIQENLTLPAEIANIDPRIPHIVEQRIAGLTWTQIAQTLDLSRRAIYDIRQKDDFSFFIQTIIPKYEKAINEYLDNPDPHIKLEAIKEAGRMRRALIPRQIQKTEQKAEIRVYLHDTIKPQNTQ